LEIAWEVDIPFGISNTGMTLQVSEKIEKALFAEDDRINTILHSNTLRFPSS